MENKRSLLTLKNSVVIKSFPSGIVLHLDPDLPFDQLLADVGEKFRESSSFFKDAKMALSLKGRVLSDFEEQQILDAITQNSELRILSSEFCVMASRICCSSKSERTRPLRERAIFASLKKLLDSRNFSPTSARSWSKGRSGSK